jgi:hypothetical protein
MVTCVIPAFTDFISDSNMKYWTGFFIIGVFAFNLLVNAIYLFYERGRSIYFLVKRAIFKWRLKKAMKRKIQN